MTDLAYGRGTRSADEIQYEIERFWAELDGSDELRKELMDAGIDIASLPDQAERADSIRVSVRGAGVEPTMVALIIAFAPVANEMLISLWKQVLLPRIRDRYGRDAIQDEKPPTP